MKVQSCRICHAPLPDEPCLFFADMPSSAQGFLSRSELAADSASDLRIYQCMGCGLVQADCEPVPYYREVIRATAFSPEMKSFRQAFLADFSETYSLKSKSILEIGCGRGEYLDLLRAAGLKPFGTEFGEAAWRACLNAGHQVQKCFPDDPSQQIDHGPFDAFASFNFLEHWPDPSAVLRTISANTTQDVIGLVEVPNFDMILRKSLFSEFIADHLSYFTADSLKLLFNLNGFEVIDCASVWHDYILSAVVRKRHAIDIGPFSQSRVGLESEVMSFLSRQEEKGVAIWGAGHQALAAISLLGIANKIRYVVDSAPFKQGRYTPASHLPIHAPTRLREEPDGAVLIMAAGFSDEIATILRGNFDGSLELAILRETWLEAVP